MSASNRCQRRRDVKVQIESNTQPSQSRSSVEVEREGLRRVQMWTKCGGGGNSNNSTVIIAGSTEDLQTASNTQGKVSKGAWPVTVRSSRVADCKLQRGTQQQQWRQQQRQRQRSSEKQCVCPGWPQSDKILLCTVGCFWNVHGKSLLTGVPCLTGAFRGKECRCMCRQGQGRQGETRI